MSHCKSLGIAYQGAPFHGWQFQSDSIPTVQLHVEAALSIIADEPIKVVCAGRTDTGVSATKQVINFTTNKDRPDKAWVKGANAHLPDSISVNWVANVDDDFNARFSAVARRYCYLLYPSSIRHALFADGYTREPRQIDISQMHTAGQYLLGENDFSSFRASKCQSQSPMRNIHHLNVSQLGELVVIDIQANAFLHHMVRNIVGSLLDVGAGVKPAGWVEELLAAKDRTLASVTAPPNGLYLVDVLYPESCGIPQQPAMPHFLNGLL